MKNVSLLVLSFCFLVRIPAHAQQGASVASADITRDGLQVSPDFLGGVVLGQKVELMMRDGTYVKGKVLRASRDEVTMSVKSSEPTGRIRGPEAILKSSEIAVVRLTKNGTAAAPIVLGVVGAIGALYAAAYAAQDVQSTGAFISVSLLSAAGGATGGALLGREAAKKTVTINVTQPKLPPGNVGSDP